MSDGGDNDTISLRYFKPTERIRKKIGIRSWYERGSSVFEDMCVRFLAARKHQLTSRTKSAWLTFHKKWRMKHDSLEHPIFVFEVIFNILVARKVLNKSSICWILLELLYKILERRGSRPACLVW